jgi:hypothetical protein
VCGDAGRRVDRVRRVGGHREGVASDLDECGKCCLVVHGELGEDLAVHLDAGFLEALDEPVVGQPVQTRSRVDTGDPQASEVTLPGAPVAVGVDEGVGDLLLGLAVQPGSLPPVTGGALQGGAPFLLGVYSPFNACHRGDSLL